MQGINQFYYCHFATCPVQLLWGFWIVLLVFIVQLVFDINLYQIVGYYLGDLVIMRSRKCEVGLKVTRIQTQLYIMIAPYKHFLIKRSVIGTIVFVKSEIIIKIPF